MCQEEGLGCFKGRDQLISWGGIGWDIRKQSTLDLPRGGIKLFQGQGLGYFKGRDWDIIKQSTLDLPRGEIRLFKGE